MTSESGTRRIRRSRTSRALVGWVAVSAISLGSDIVLDNSSWELSLIGTAGSATLLAYALVTLVLQWQYAEANRADFLVNSRWADMSVSGLPGTGPFRQVFVTNTGGHATIDSVQFSIEIDGEHHEMTLPALKDLLWSPGGLMDTVHYRFANLTSGAPLIPGTPILLFECVEPVVGRFDKLSAAICYTAPLLDLYERTFSLLPYAGAAPPPRDPESEGGATGA